MIDPFSDAERRRTPVELRHTLEKRGQSEKRGELPVRRIEDDFAFVLAVLYTVALALVSWWIVNGGPFHVQ